MFGSCGRFRFGVRIIYGTAVSSRNIVHLQKILPTLYRSLLLYFYFFL